MAQYTYTTFDADPNSSSGTAWDTHTDVELEADSDEEALAEVNDVMSTEAAGLSPVDGYEVGQRLYAIVWSEDETIVGQPTYDLTRDDLGVRPEKSEVSRWESVASYVATFPSDDGEGAADVSVQIGEAHGVWFVRTDDDAGGSDDADDTAYDTREAAEAAADALAAGHDEGGGEDADGYLRTKLVAAAGDPDPDGEWCVYWTTALDDAGPRERYASDEQAQAAAKLANEGLRANNPGSHLLCGYEVRRLVDGEWVGPREEE